MKFTPDSMFRGGLIGRAEEELARALGELGPEAPVGPRDREGNPVLYGLPISYGCLGHRVEKLHHLGLILQEARRLMQGQNQARVESRDSGRETPDSRLQTPDSGRETPDSRLQTPDSGREAPDSRLQTPDSGRETPASRLQTPDSGRETPDSRLQTPDSGRETPDFRLQTPDSGREAPDFRLQTPDSGREAPDFRLQTPDSQIGLAFLLAQEVRLTLGSVYGQEPAAGQGAFYNGPVAESWLRSLGIRLLDGRLAGLALISGAGRDREVAASLVHQLHSKGLLLFLSGEKLIGQLAGQVEWGYDSAIIPLGPEADSLAYAFGFAASFALHFGKLSPGDFRALVKYNHSNLHAFHLSLGPLDEPDPAALAGSIAFGFPIVSDVELPWTGFTPSGFFSLPFDQLSGENDLEKAGTLADRCIDLGGIKVIVPREPAIPVEYRTEFEGETISADNLQVELKGFEWLSMRDMAEVKDGHIKVVGPEIEETGSEAPIGLLVEVAGRRMKRDFEPVLERQILHLINGAEGVQYDGQRDRIRVRFSKEAVQKGLRVEHLGHILHSGLHSQFDAIVDKVQVIIYTEEAGVRRLLEQAREVYRERDSRVAGMREDEADTFYSCLSCQSLTPYHLCIITPEKAGMCGSVNFLDGQASYEINPVGPNQPIVKEGCLDPAAGEWESIDRYVYHHSQMKFSRFCLHSILDDPATVSSLCECLTVLMPEANGVMVISREDPSMTPLGMDFGELMNMAASTQTPGIIGHAKSYLASDKFLAAEGGIKRVVWMSAALKEELAEGLKEACRRAGEPDLMDKIADGDICTDSESVLAFLEEKGHPALTMDPVI